jgi:hypothetical protein
VGDDIQPMNLPPFPAQYRASAVLLHVTSLPSPYGVGDVGPAALKWIDQLHEAGQAWWQALPLGPPGYGNSPYRGRQLELALYRRVVVGCGLSFAAGTDKKLKPHGAS